MQPKPITTEIPALKWPDVVLDISDDRATRHAHDRLVYAVEYTIRQALPPASDAPPRHHLAVAVLRHEAGFVGGGSPMWIGTTELRAVLSVAPSGDSLASWTVSDTHEEWNAWGYGSGTDAAQYSLRDALRKLLRRMAAEVQFAEVLPSGAVIVRPSVGRPRPEPTAEQPAVSSELFCRRRATGMQPREAWLAAYRRCLAGH